MDGKQDLLALSDTIFERTHRRVDGLTEAEYVWEPADGCWSVRTGADGEAMADGATLADGAPLTTIAWRLWHMTGVYGQARNARWLGTGRTRNPSDRDESEQEAEQRCAARATAAEAIAALEAAHEWWRSVLVALDEDDLTALLGPRAGPYAASSQAAFVLHQLDEIAHHGAEIGLLRDLYRASFTAPPMDASLATVLRGEAVAGAEAERLRSERPDLVAWAAANGYWQALPVLIGMGIDVNAPYKGTTALHHAAAAAPLTVVRTLVDHGADLEFVDDMFQTTPVGWARHFRRRAIIDYLSQASQASRRGQR